VRVGCPFHYFPFLTNVVVGGCIHPSFEVVGLPSLSAVNFHSRKDMVVAVVDVVDVVDDTYDHTNNSVGGDNTDFAATEDVDHHHTVQEVELLYIRSVDIEDDGTVNEYWENEE